MKVCIYGLGAVGALIGARLLQAGCSVTAVARSATLAAVRQHGLQLQTPSARWSLPLQASDNPAELGHQDVVILAVKAPALPEIAATIAPLLGPSTAVVTAMNGVPWWYFQPPAVPYAGSRLPSLDPTGELTQRIPFSRIIGCVVHLSSSRPEPGVVTPGLGNRLILGEPDGSRSKRVERLAGLLAAAGFETEVSGRIRTEIWYKLWGNMTLNPISVLTGATVDKILEDPLLETLCLDAMAEAAAIGDRIGCGVTQSGQARLEVGRRLGSFKTSMLQDAEAGKPLEIDALITCVHELGQMVGQSTRNIDALLGLTRLYAATRGLYSPQGRTHSGAT